MRVLAIAFSLILWSTSWNCNWRKENSASSIFGCNYCTAESAVVGTKRP